MSSLPHFAAHGKKRRYYTQSESPVAEIRDVFFAWIKKFFHICGFLIRLPFVCFFIVLLFPVAYVRKFFSRQTREPQKKKISIPASPHAWTLHGRILPSRIGTRRKKSSSKKILSWRMRHVGGCAIVAGIFALPFAFSNLLGELSSVRAQTLRYAAAGIQNVTEAKNGFEEFRLEEADTHFQQAFSDFTQAKKSMEKINTFLSALAQIAPGKGSALADGKALLDAGQNIAQAGTHVARAGSAFQPPFQLFDTGFLASFERMNRELKIASPFLARADERLGEIHTGNIPLDNREKFLQMRRLLHTLSGHIRESTDLGDGVIRVFAKNQLRRYLVVFQNSTELRPTGGFIGSFALVDFADGKLKHIEIPHGGPYDLQGSLRETVISPEPLHMVNPIWQFQDANWFVDFPTSAKKLMWFYEKSGGPTVDGVIAINDSIAKKLIQFTGPIPMPEYGKTITSENFLEETQKAVEIEYDREKNTPKKFISDLVPRMIILLSEKTKGNVMPFIKIVSDAVRTRDIQLYFRSSPDQELFRRFGATGELRNTGGDYLMIVDTNVGAGKSDGVIEESVAHTVTVHESGTLTAHLLIKRNHHGNRSNPFTGLQNIDYVRFYVPYGSTVLSASGFQEMDISLFKRPPMEYHLDSDLKAIERDETFDIVKKIATHTELGKTVIAGWIVTDVGESRMVELVYQLPFTAKDVNRDGYSLLLQRQSGSRIGTYVFDAILPSGQTTVWTYPRAQANGSGFHWETSALNMDHVFGFTIKQ